MTAIGNARRFLDVSSEFGTFDDDIWRLVGGKPKAALTVASPPAADAGQMVRGAATASHRKTASDRLGNDSLACRTASGGVRPLASPAAMAEAKVQPVPWVFPESNRGDRRKWSSPPPQSTSIDSPSMSRCPPFKTTQEHPILECPPGSRTTARGLPTP
jgi:hypothetical protein